MKNTTIEKHGTGILLAVLLSGCACNPPLSAAATWVITGDPVDAAIDLAYESLTCE